jgi:hypothetical protein
MVMKGFNKVRSGPGYGVEHAGGNTGLKHGDEIEVAWPDGTITLEKLIVVVGAEIVQIDMNRHPDSIPTRKLFVERKIYGHPVRVPLRGLGIRKAL